jgi:hypothetical protein
MHGRSTRSKRSRLALRLAVLGAIAVEVASGLSFVWWGGFGPDLLGLIGLLGFVGVGALILDRRPGEPVGRICLGIGFIYGIAAGLRGIAGFVDSLDGFMPPFFVAVAVVSSTLAGLALLLSGPLLISRFPRRAPDPWQRRVEDLLLWIVALVVIFGALKPGPVEAGAIESASNPLALPWFPVDADTLFTLTFLIYGLTYVVTTVGLANRYRRGGSIVRAQIRWFAAAVTVTLALFLVTFLSPGNETVNAVAWSAWIVSLLLPPIAIAVAILRYRLYDIDRIISNAIGYGLVTVVLFAVYFVVNLFLVSQVSPLVNNEGVAVAASTLLVAALFNPLRTRVQHGVDHRFHRARYDADRMVHDFSARLRDELDLPTLARELATTSGMAVEPTSSAVWIRGDGLR